MHKSTAKQAKHWAVMMLDTRINDKQYFYYYNLFQLPHVKPNSLQ